MLKISVRDATPGMTLALPVVDPRQPQHVLLRIGYSLEPDVLERLKELGVRYLWVRCPPLDFLSQFVNHAALAEQAEVFVQIGQTFNHLQTQATPRIQYQNYCRTISRWVENLVSCPQAGLFLDDLACTEPGLDLLRHSSTVTYLSLLMGLKLEGYLVRQRRHIDPARAKEVVNLGVGAMLHDIGIAHLPDAVRQRYLHRRDESDPAWQEHPTLGYRLVREHVEPSAATVVLNHHQRWDGSGYGGSAAPVLAGERIHVFARIAALADYFDRLRQLNSPRPLPTAAVLQYILDPAISRLFDPQVIAALLAVVPPFPPGSFLRLSDGRVGVCIAHKPSDPCRPMIQLLMHADRRHPEHLELGPTVDLSEEHRGVFVIQCDDQDVAAFNFSPPPMLRERLALSMFW